MGADETHGIGTRAIHAGQVPDPTTGAIMTPVYLTSTYVQESPGQHKGYEYSRTDNPTRTALQDCVAALSTMVTSDAPSGRTYFVEDGTPQDTATMARRIGAAVGRGRVRIIRVPSPILRVAGAVSEGIGRLRRVPVLLHRDKVRELLQPHWACSAGALRDDLGWAPQVAFDAGVDETAAAYLAAGQL